MLYRSIVFIFKTHTWKSTRKPGSDIAVMSLEKKWTSNMVKMYLKPFPNPGYNTRMFIKAITLKGCYQLGMDNKHLSFKLFVYLYDIRVKTRSSVMEHLYCARYIHLPV